VQLCLLAGHLSETIFVPNKIKVVHHCKISVTANNSTENLGDYRTQNQLVHLQCNQVALILLFVALGRLKTKLTRYLHFLGLNVEGKGRRDQFFVDKSVDDRQVNVDELKTGQFSHQRFLVLLFVLTIFFLYEVDGQLFESKVSDTNGCIQQNALKDNVFYFFFEEDVKKYRC